MCSFFRMIKMDFYRMVRMKSFWILLLVITAETALLVFDISYSMEYYGETIASSADKNVKIPICELVNYLSSGLVLIIASAIFVPLFVNGESKSGFLKSIGGLIPNRGYIAGAKLFSITVYSLVTYAFLFIATIVCSKIFMGYVYFSGNPGKWIKVLAIQILLYTAINFFIAFLAIWWNSSGASITVGVLLASGTFDMISGVINSVINNVLKIADNFDISKYFITTYLQNFSSANLTHSLICGIVYLSVSAVLGILIMSRRDVK